MTQILMPALSPTMEEGKLAKWLVKEGDAVHSGDILAEIETDKATMEFEAVDEGKIGKILVPEGTEGVKVNQPIAELVADGEAPSKPAPAAAKQAEAAPAARSEARARREGSLQRKRRARSRSTLAAPTGARSFPPAPNSSP